MSEHEAKRESKVTDDDTQPRSEAPSPEGPEPGIIRQAEDSDRRAFKVVAVLFVLALLWLVFGRGDDDDDSAGSGQRLVDAFTPVTVKYKVTGTATSADITIETPGGTSQQQDVKVPLRTETGSNGLTFSFNPGDFVYISAQNNGSGTITCEIVSDGITISKITSSGEFAIATCDGQA